MLDFLRRNKSSLAVKIILGLIAFAIIDSIIAAIKTFKRRRALGAAVKSLGYCPFFFTTGSIGTLLQRLFAE